MWVAANADKLRDIKKNLSEFAREVVAPTYEESYSSPACHDPGHCRSKCPQPPSWMRILLLAGKPLI